MKMRNVRWNKSSQSVENVRSKALDEIYLRLLVRKCDEKNMGHV